VRAGVPPTRPPTSLASFLDERWAGPSSELLVTELEADGLVERAADPDDGRATLARITDQSRTALRRAAPVYLRGINEHLSRHLSPTEQQGIANGLQKVIDAHTAAIDPRR
jgi:hypothetical protein